MILRHLSRILEKWPLKKQLGFYAYMPLFFALGAGVEFVMIKFKVGQTDFYSVYLRKEKERLLQDAENMNKLLDQKKEAYKQRTERSNTRTD